MKELESLLQNFDAAELAKLDPDATYMLLVKSSGQFSEDHIREIHKVFKAMNVRAIVMHADVEEEVKLYALGKEPVTVKP